MANAYGYLIGWPVQNLWYIGVRYSRGCTPSDLWVSYFTSSKEVKAAREEHGEPSVVRVLRTFASGEEATVWETRILRRLKAAHSPHWLNLSYGGGEFLNTTEKAKERLRQAWTDERRAAAKGFRPGYSHSEETRAKIGAASALRPSVNKGKTLSEEHRNNLRLANLGRTPSPEARAKMSATRKGRKQTPEQIAKRVASRMATLANKEKACQ